ncbi:contact-dependent growth inhibition system immunity protein [Pseudomonas sp. 6D_7.1_Bac1]|uniref:contact-dependent growth inhibition system immunity protein n=1 Tax=Pseudomonas sp. 6D_7.1_Bac1 TaxID=2971615 RepID=UPI0021C594E3|nr:contact-dependent growth inhibition system immunity protein [Pseudomonas sp. 6D_7.1_Bac1]MCU1749824.1 contact-dependent growth inhibition system immunity protein [Pseudomonas sp. 6D_7.1_Bac1]
MSTKFPALFQFLAGYLHQDWACDHETVDDVIRSFVADSSLENISQVKDELQVVLRTIQSEEELQTFLFDEIGCSYYYPYAWSSGKAWLEHVLAML